MCGEKQRANGTVRTSSGSPPRVRGKVQHLKLLIHRAGITPACAGKSCTRTPTWTPRRDHPRVCGEKAAEQDFRHCRTGSPPRVRGKDKRLPPPMHAIGITPACAGKSGPVEVGPFTIFGSPPRVRGKVDAALQLMLGLGITPACAGKSPVSPRRRDVGEDHPRVCGEKCFLRFFSACRAGSPPPVRGKGRRRGLLRKADRITPACAGKRLRKSHNSAILSSRVTRFH